MNSRRWSAARSALALSVLLARCGIGLARSDKSQSAGQAVPFLQVVKAMTPTLLLIAILIVTRVHQLGLKALLNNTALLWQEKLGWLGELRISRALIVELQQVLGTSAAAGYKTLYVPALILFLLVVLLCIPLFRLNGGRAANVQRNRRAHCAALYCAVRRAGDGQPDDAGRRQRAGDPDR